MPLNAKDIVWDDESPDFKNIQWDDDEIQWDDEVSPVEERPELTLSRLGEAQQEGVKDVFRSTLQGASGILTHGLPDYFRAGVEAILPIAKAFRGAPTESLGKDVGKLSEAPEFKTAPEFQGESSGYIEDLFRSAPQMGTQIAATIAGGPFAGMGLMGLQITGNTYENAVKEGKNPEQALAWGMANAIVQAPLEQIGVGKISKLIQPQKLIIKKLKDIGEAAGVEWLTEFLQSYPDSIANIFATNPDKTALENLDKFIDDIPETTKQGAYEGLLTAPWALLGAGGMRSTRPGQPELTFKENLLNDLRDPNTPLKLSDLQKMKEDPRIIGEGLDDEVNEVIIEYANTPEGKAELAKMNEAEVVEEPEISPEDIISPPVAEPTIQEITDFVDESIKEDIPDAKRREQAKKNLARYIDSLNKPLPGQMGPRSGGRIVDETTAPKPSKEAKAETADTPESIAKELGIKYDGVQTGIGPQWTDINADPGKQSTFYTKKVDKGEVKKNLDEMRAKFKEQEKVEPVTQVGKETPGEVPEKKGAVDWKLTEKKERLEKKLAQLDRQIKSSDKTDMPGTLFTGRSGVPGSRMKKLDRQMDRRIDRAVEREKLEKDLAWVKGQIRYQEEGPIREKQEKEVGELFEKQFDKINVGDQIDIGGNDLQTVVKKNAKTVVTEGGVKWKADEIAKVIPKSPPQAPKQARGEEKGAGGGVGIKEAYETVRDRRKEGSQVPIADILDETGMTLEEIEPIIREGMKDGTIVGTKASWTLGEAKTPESIKKATIWTGDIKVSDIAIKGAGEVAEGVKEPWEMTKVEYRAKRKAEFKPLFNGTLGRYNMNDAYVDDQRHESEVRKAIKEGKIESHPDYPDLAPKKLFKKKAKKKIFGKKAKDQAIEKRMVDIIQGVKDEGRIYVVPQITVEYGDGKTALVKTGPYLKDAGLVPDEDLNYWRTETPKQAPAKEGKEALQEPAKPTPGWAWIRDQQKPFTQYRELKRGKNKGKVEVVVGGKKYIIPKDKVRVYPGEKGETELSVAKGQPLFQARPAEITERGAEELFRIREVIFKRAKEILPPKEFARTELLLEPTISPDISKKIGSQKSIQAHGGIKGRAILGYTIQWDNYNLINLAFNYDNQTVEHTAIHEPLHIIWSRYMTDNQRAFMLRKHGNNKETAINSLADYIQGKQTPQAFSKRIVESIKRLLNAIRQALKGEGYLTEEMLAEKIMGQKLKERPPSETGDISLAMAGETEHFWVEVGNNVKVEVIKNPTVKDLRALSKEFREKYPNATGEPYSRTTYDASGNEYVWRSYEATHGMIEPRISARIGAPVNQNQYMFEDSETELSISDTYLDRYIDVAVKGEKGKFESKPFLDSIGKEDRKKSSKEGNALGASNLKSSVDMAKEIMSPKLDEFMYWVVDKNHPIQKVQKKLSTMTEELDLFMSETQRPKITADKIKTAWNDEIVPMLEAMAKANVSIEAFGEYAHAKHAPEANIALRHANSKRFIEKILNVVPNKESEEFRDSLKEDLYPEEFYAKLNEAFETFGDNELVQNIKESWDAFSEKPSGMTDAEASKILKANEGNEEIEKIRLMLSQINSKRLDILYDAGLLPDGEYEAIKKKYKHYVPLYREGFDDGTFGTGKGLQPAGRPVKTRMGSTRNVVDIIANSVSNLENAISRAEKAASAKTFVDLIKQNPDSDLWSVGEVKKSPRHDTAGNIRMYPDMFSVAPNEMRVMVDGKQYLVTVNRNNKDAMRMLKTLKAEDTSGGPFMNALSKLNRYLARINTSLSPEFIVSNFIRDFQTAGININDTGVESKRMLRGTIDSVKAIYRVERDNRNGSELEKVYDRFKAAGGKISWADVHGSVEKLSKKLSITLDMMSRKRVVRKKLTDVFDLIENANTSIENGVRLHAFNLATQQGMSDKKAAQIASDLTVDFTKKGAAGPAINSLYLFANAGIQGSYRIIRASKNPKVQKIMGGIVVAGFLTGLLNSIVGGDDDDGEDYYNKIDDFVRERNMIFIIPGSKGKYVKIPLPWGYNVFWNAGDELSKIFTSENYKPMAGAGRLASVFVGAFNPIQAGTLLQTLAPTIADPFAMVAENKNWFGGDLTPAVNKFDKTPSPDSERYWKSASTPSKWITSQLNSITGGNKIRSGEIDVNPHTLDLVVDTLGGSMLRFFKDTAALPGRLFSKEKIETHKIPFVRRLAGDKYEGTDSRIYYENISEVLTTKEELKAYKGTDQYFPLLNKIGNKRSLIPLAERSEKKLRKLRKEYKKAEINKNTEVMEKTRKAMKKIYLDFNRAFNSSKKKPKPTGLLGRPTPKVSGLLGYAQ